jgi:hypothetical protein
MVRIVSSDRLGQGRVREALLFRNLYLCQKGKQSVGTCFCVRVYDYVGGLTMQVKRCK